MSFWRQTVVGLSIILTVVACNQNNKDEAPVGDAGRAGGGKAAETLGTGPLMSISGAITNDKGDLDSHIVVVGAEGQEIKENKIGGVAAVEAKSTKLSEASEKVVTSIDGKDYISIGCDDKLSEQEKKELIEGKTKIEDEKIKAEFLKDDGVLKADTILLCGNDNAMILVGKTLQLQAKLIVMKTLQLDFTGSNDSVVNIVTQKLSLRDGDSILHFIGDKKLGPKLILSVQEPIDKDAKVLSLMNLVTKDEKVLEEIKSLKEEKAKGDKPAPAAAATATDTHTTTETDTHEQTQQTTGPAAEPHNQDPNAVIIE